MSVDYSSCEKVCPPVLKEADANKPRLARPPPPVKHLKNTALHRTFRNYDQLPYAPYPPGGVPTGGDPALRISSAEWARRAAESDCFQCHVRQDVKAASRLRLNWRFWVGVGGASLGAITILLTSKRA